MEIWIHKNGQLAGRFSESAIREKIADGSFSATDLAWSDAKSAWQPIPEFLESVPKTSPESTPAASTEKAATEPVEKSAAEASTEKAVTEPVEKSTAEGSTEKAATEPEAKRSDLSSAPSGAKPPPLPDMTPAIAMPIPATGPPPLPTFTTPSVASGPGSSIPATAQPPSGETIWSPWIAILGSVFLSPAFGGFIVWRNWLTMKRRRRALVAAPWFWLGFVVIGLLFYARSGLALLIWAAYLVAWIAFSAFPQIRYIHTTFKREKARWGLPLLASLVLFAIGFTVFQVTKPAIKTPLAPGPEQPTTQQPQQLSQPQSKDRVFTAEELRDIYKSSVLEVRATWNERRSSINRKENGANGTGVLVYNDSEYGLVATNWHVVEPSDGMTGDYRCGVRFSHDKDFADALVVARARNDVDLALLLVRLDGKWTPNQFPVRALDQIKEGECCIAIGNALGEGLSITAGIISRFDKVKDQTLIRTSTPVSPGNSGGPLILCRGGALAGIVTLQSRITNVQNVNFATPAQLILDKDIWDFEPDQEQAQELLDKAIAQAKK